MSSDSTLSSANSGLSPAAAGLQRQRRARIRRERLKQSWPWLIWLLVGGLVVWSVSRGRIFERMNGQVEENYQYIAPNQDGRLLRILVKPGDTVAPGGLVAELDPEPWNLQLRALLTGLVEKRRDDLTDRLRERGLVERELGRQKESLAADEGRLAALTSAKPAEGPLAPSRQDSVDALKADAAEVSGRLEITRALIPQLETRLAGMDADTTRLRAEAEQTAAAAADLDQDPQTLLAIFPENERHRLEELLHGRNHCRILSSIGGTVDKVVKTPGDYLLAGDHLLEMVGQPKHITAFVSSTEAAALQPGDRVWVTPAHGRKWAIHETTVVRAAPDAERLPLSSKAGSGSYQAGRRITVAFPPSAHSPAPGASAGLLPGEGITVHLQHPGELSLFRRLSTMAAD